jgi:replication-associated recombination protein RarA
LGGKMKLYIENIDEEKDKFVATVKGDSKELMGLMNFYYENVKKRDSKVETEILEKQIKAQVENARKKFEEKKDENSRNKD